MDSLLVTGATGFVGRNLIVRAAARGMKILAPVRNPAKLAACLAEDGIPPDSVRLLPTEPSDWSGISPDQAVLCAGVLFARTREEYFSVNVDWTLRILRALPRGCRVVLLSSQSAGGPTPAGRAARTEADPDCPITWYGESKKALEQAVAREFPDRRITILRPPMILGARDSATLPLFKMARGPVRTKPGFRKKWFSYLAVGDVVDAAFAAFECPRPGPFYIAASDAISDVDLIASAARTTGSRGVTLRLPLIFIRALAALVDAVPSWRDAVPSLTRDRAREIWPDRWVVDSSAFRAATGWSHRIGLEEALQSACEHYSSTGRL